LSDKKRNAIQEQYYSMLDQMAETGDRTGLNKVLNSRAFKKLKMVAGVGKIAAGAVGGKAAEMLAPMLPVSSAMMLMSGAKQTADAQKNAYQRNLNQKAGTGSGFGDAAASAASAGSSFAKLMKTGAYGAAAMGGGLNTSLLSTGMMGSSLFGGMQGMGSAAAGGLASGAGMLGLGSAGQAAISGLSPMGMGIASMIAMQKGAGALNKYMSKDSSTKIEINRTQMTTMGTSPHELETTYGSTRMLQMQIKRLQNQHQMKPGESLIANILAMIEGHTSVLPFIAAESVDNESRKNKEGGYGGQKTLSDTFGDDGTIHSADSSTKDVSLTNRFFGGIEMGMANALSTFDPGTYLSATLQGKSVTEMYNTANSKIKGVDALQSEEQFAEKMGVSSSLVQAIHTTPSQIMSKASTFESKQLSILGLISEISRFSAHELLKIRTDGFGITQASSHGLLARIREENEINNMADDSFYESHFKTIDEKLGYIPGYNVLSGTAKMASGGYNWVKDMFGGDLEKDADGNQVYETDENGDTIMERQASGKMGAKKKRKKNRGLQEVMYDWMASDLSNTTLNSEEALRDAVGATELGPQDLMANYLGKAYPDRFELLLKYNHSQMESLKSMAGPIKRSKFDELSMNKFDGTFAGNDYHAAKDEDIKDRMMKQMTTLNASPSIWGQMFSAKNEDKLIDSQLKKARGGNSFLDNFLNSDGQSVSSISSKNKDETENVSAQDAQDSQKSEEQQERKFSMQERQLILLEEIRDGVCGNCTKGNRKKISKRMRKNQEESGLLDGFGGIGYDFGGGGGGPGKRTVPKPKAPAGGASLWQRTKDLFGKLNFKKLGFMGVLKNIGSVFPTAIMAVLRIPYVAAALAVGAVAYSAYKYAEFYFDNAEEERLEEKGKSGIKNDGAISKEQKNNLDEAMIHFNTSTQLKDESIAKLRTRFKDMDNDELMYMLKEGTLNLMVRTAIRLELKERTGKTVATNVSGNALIDYTMGSGDNTWERGGRAYWETLSKKDQKAMLAADGDMLNQKFHSSMFKKSKVVATDPENSSHQLTSEEAKEAQYEKNRMKIKKSQQRIDSTFANISEDRVIDKKDEQLLKLEAIELEKMTKLDINNESQSKIMMAQLAALQGIIQGLQASKTNVYTIDKHSAFAEAITTAKKI
jgi:hypothetical protein